MNSYLIHLKHLLAFNTSILPFIGRSHYERLNSRLTRQIKIRQVKREALAYKRSFRKQVREFAICED